MRGGRRLCGAAGRGRKITKCGRRKEGMYYIRVVSNASFSGMVPISKHYFVSAGEDFCGNCKRASLSVFGLIFSILTVLARTVGAGRAHYLSGAPVLVLSYVTLRLKQEVVVVTGSISRKLIPHTVDEAHFRESNRWQPPLDDVFCNTPFLRTPSKDRFRPPAVVPVGCILWTRCLKRTGAGRAVRKEVPSGSWLFISSLPLCHVAQRALQDDVPQRR